MKKKILNLLVILLLVYPTIKLSAQTSGTLTFTFTEVAKSTSATYNNNAQHVLAAWIQTSAGTFIKTKLRYAGSGTNDHLPTWAANAGCASSSNCLGAACNVVDGTTGATRSSWTSYTITWDGKKGAAATGTLQADGVYKVTLQSTWDHGTAGTATSSYTFTKGPNADHQTPAANSTFTGVKLDWVPALSTGIEGNIIENPIVNLYPNPTDGIFNVDFKNATCIKVINTLGDIIYEEKIETTVSEGTKNIDLSAFANGIYIINVANERGSSNHKIILNK